MPTNRKCPQPASKKGINESLKDSSKYNIWSRADKPCAGGAVIFVMIVLCMAIVAAHEVRWW